MKIDMIQEAILSTLPGESIVQDRKEEKPSTISGMEAYIPQVPSGSTPQRDCDVPASGEGRQQPIWCRTLPYVKLVVADTAEAPEHTEWTFFLNGFELTSKATNEFSVLMNTIRPEDKVVIHGPSFISEESAIGMCSMIEACPADVTIHSPYCLNTGATLFHSVGNHHTVSPYMYARITTPVVFAYGSHLDSKSSVEFGTNFYNELYLRLCEKGIMTKEEYQKVTQEQKSVTIYGKELMLRINKQNPSRPTQPAE